LAEITIYFVVSIYSIIFAYSRLNRKGMSHDVKRLFMKKQMYYVFAYMTMWFCYVGNTIVKIA